MSRRLDYTYPEYNDRVPVSPTELRPFSQEEWLIKLTVECKNRIEAVRRNERVKTFYIRANAESGKSTWACMLDYWHTWYNYEFMNPDVWKPGDTVIIAHNMLYLGFEEYKSYFKGDTPNKLSVRSSTQHIFSIKRGLFIFIHEKSIDELGWKAGWQKDIIEAYIDYVI